MAPQNQSEPETYIRLLADQARKLQREARGAIDQGDYARAEALIGDAELLAGDVHILVGDIEHREIGNLMTRAAADAKADTRPRRKRMRLRLRMPTRRVRMALGTSLAMSLALTEC